MTVIIDFSFPGQWTTTATSCIPHDSVFMPAPHARKSEKGFFVMIIDSKYSKMTPKFVKQKWHWLHSSIKFANPVKVKENCVYWHFAFLKSYEVPNKFALKFYITWNLSLFFFACLVPNIQHGDITENMWKMILRLFKVTPPSYFVGVPSYFEALWYPHLYFDRESNI